jgi:hypothetical protein
LVCFDVKVTKGVEKGEQLTLRVGVVVCVWRRVYDLSSSEEGLWLVVNHCE